MYIPSTVLDSFKNHLPHPRASKCFDEIPDTFTFTDYIDCIQSMGRGNCTKAI